MKREVIAEHLAASVLFCESTAKEIANYAQMARVQVFALGDYVYHGGEPSDIFYVVALGEAELIHEEGARKVVARVGPGGHFGETGILTGKPRSLSVRALCDLVVICFDKRYFRSTFLAGGRIHRQLDATLAERLRVAFNDQADNSEAKKGDVELKEADNVLLFAEKNPSAIKLRRIEKKRKNDIRQSRTAKKTQAIIKTFAATDAPYLLTGESGTGKSIIARQVHVHSDRQKNQYREIDLREYEPVRLVRKLFGFEQSAFPFAQVHQAGFFEQTAGGTIVLTHAHLMTEKLQRTLVEILASHTYANMDGEKPMAMQSRLVLVSHLSFDHLRSTGKFIPELLELLENNRFHVVPLREHKEDLPRLVSHYLGRFSLEYGKEINAVNHEILGIFMNYDWPGNLNELANVVRRAVMLAPKNEILPEQILLGLPKTEGKWEYNILRIPWVKKLLNSSLFPRLPQALIGLVLLITILFLFFGPKTPVANLGLTLGWYIGWPLMFFSFFFLARTWCSVCSLAVPGTVLQDIVKPTRKRPEFIAKYSGWIMATLCILVFWVETVWDAYNNPLLTGAIILIISLGSSLFSVLYSRRAWCRYLCPLGAVNAIFAMPSVVELRSNSHVCLNRCQSHSCYRGDEEIPGCPMFRHPYMVDNNRDCIVCAKCIKSCDNSSVQLNLRLAPQELWALKTPRRADSFLIVAMGAIFFPFALNDQFNELSSLLTLKLAGLGVGLPQWFFASLLFFTVILLFQLGYYLMVTVQAAYARMDRRFLLSLFGYGFIPLILGGYMALHLEFFVQGAGRLVPNVQQIFGLPHSYQDLRLISADSTFVLQCITIFGGGLAALYATFRIVKRGLVGEPVTSKSLVIPFSFITVVGFLFLFMV